MCADACQNEDECCVGDGCAGDARQQELQQQQQQQQDAHIIDAKVVNANDQLATPTTRTTEDARVNAIRAKCNLIFSLSIVVILIVGFAVTITLSSYHVKQTESMLLKLSALQQSIDLYVPLSEQNRKDALAFYQGQHQPTARWHDFESFLKYTLEGA